MATQTAFRLDDDLRGMLKEAAKDGRPMAWHVDKALRQYFGKSKPKTVSKVVAAPKQELVKVSGADEVIDYLNLRAGTKYRYSKASRDCIEPRLKEFSIDDCKLVIDKKCNEWLDTENAKYLRPETLFRVSKFEGYLNQIVATGGVKQDDTSWASELGDITGQQDDGAIDGQFPGVEEFLAGPGQCQIISSGLQAPASGGDEGEQCQLGHNGELWNGQG